MPVRFRIIVVVILVVTLVAAATYWTRRSQCVEMGDGLRGEVKVRPNGETLYYDGRCWTTKPLPPLDMPF